MNMNIENAVTANEENVSRLAYQLWEQAGRPVGRDLEFWLAAEAKLRNTPRPSVISTPVLTAPTAPAREKNGKSPRATGAGVKKTWPKPYPALPKF